MCHYEYMHPKPSTWAALLDIIYENQVPLLTVTDETQSAKIKVKVMKIRVDLAFSVAENEMEDTTAANRKPVAKDRRYVCISHIWSE